MPMPYALAKRMFDSRRYAEAFALYEELAKSGDPRCQVLLGWMYYEGLGTHKDTDRGLSCFKEAANANSSEGAFYVGKCLVMAGHYQEAFGWFQKAATQEYGPALLWLGLAHVRGLGVSVNICMGVPYLERAARTGNFLARRELALLMIRGKLGISKILEGVVLLPYAIVAALVSSISRGHSDKLMG